nr:hypothetical protein CFP56_45677 [Quercus suber]
MTETRSFFVLNDKYNALSLAIDQNAQEILGINQKLDAFTSMLQNLTQTVQELTEAGSQWHQRQANPERLVPPVAPVFQETTLASVPRTPRIFLMDGLQEVVREVESNVPLEEGGDVYNPQQELNQFDGSGYSEGFAEITLYALLGSPLPGTMRIWGRINYHDMFDYQNKSILLQGLKSSATVLQDGD